MSQHFQGIADRVRELATPLAERDGYELVDVEYLREGGRWVLRLVLDRAGGISLDDCQAFSRQVDRVLDVEDFIEPAYSLEVSSPGIERPLKTRAHFERFVGREAQVRTFGPIGDPPRKNYKGRILGVSGEGEVRLHVDGQEFAIPLDKIAKAHLTFDLEAELKR